MLQEFQVRSVKKECHAKSVKSNNSVLLDCLTRVSSKKCLPRVSYKSVLQECL